MTSKVTAILLVFARGSSYSLTELARLTGLPVSTAHRIAGELTARRVLERTEDGDYRIGLPLRRIGAPVAAGAGQAPDLLQRARASLSDLVVATGSAVHLGVPDGAGVAVATVRPGGPPLGTPVPSPVPAHATPLGRVLLAFGPPGSVDRAVELARPVEAGARLRRSLRVTRLTRVAVSAQAPAAVAMPVFGPGGEVLAAVQLDVPDLRAGLAGARAALAVATGSLSRELATVVTLLSVV